MNCLKTLTILVSINNLIDKLSHRKLHFRFFCKRQNVWIYAGITKEQAEQAVKMMPKDPKVLASMMTDKLAGSKDTFEQMGLPG